MYCVKYLISFVLFQLKYHGNRAYGGEDKIKYWTHKGEQIPDDPPSPVLMVQKLKLNRGQPYWIKDYMRQIGLNHSQRREDVVGIKVFLPNTPSVCMILQRVKHMVKITPLTFPNGIPDDFDPATHGYKLSATGEFAITDRPLETTESIAARAHWMKIDEEVVRSET